jgi:uncharacterized protein
MELITNVMEIFSKIDQQVAIFKLKTGLKCQGGCGMCCVNGKVYASAIEMFPAAHRILCQDDSQEWLERIQNQGVEGLCILYQKQGLDNNEHCAFYTWRPCVCRLFGFASVRNRLGKHILSTCRPLKDNHPKEVAKAIKQQHEAPCFTQFIPQLLNIDQSAVRLLPINDALKQAILTLGLWMQMTHKEKLSSHHTHRY